MTFYVWARIAPREYESGDLVRDGEGAYLYAAETEAEVWRAIATDPATYETADGEPASLYVVVGDARTWHRVDSGPHRAGVWPGPRDHKRYRPGLSAFVSLAEAVR